MELVGSWACELEDYPHFDSAETPLTKIRRLRAIPFPTRPIPGPLPPYNVRYEACNEREYQQLVDARPVGRYNQVVLF